jgi:hypothetical protein
VDISVIVQERMNLDCEMNDDSRKRVLDECQASSGPVMCHACHTVDITAPQPRFFLFCKKKLMICAACFSKCSSDRQCRPFVVCPCCQSRRTRWEVEYTETKSASRQVTIRSVSATHTSELMEPDKTEDPVRYHQRMADRELESGSAGADNFIGFSLTMCKDRHVTVLSEMDPYGGDCNDWGEEQRHLLENIFQNFHHLLRTNEGQRQRQGDINPHCAPPTAQGLRSLGSNDYSPLHRMIFMMAYGEPLRKYTSFDPHAPRFQKLVITTFAVTDMLRNVRTEKQGVR